MDELLDAMAGLGEHDGYFGMFTRYETSDAYPNGTRVTKIWSEPSDAHPIGALGTVLGSLRHPEEGIAYFIEWDASPHCAVLVVAKKLGLVTDSTTA